MTLRPPAILATLLFATSFCAQVEAATGRDPGVPVDATQPDTRAVMTVIADPDRIDVLSDRRGFHARPAARISQGAVVSETSSGGAQAWQFRGPEGGSVKDIALSPTSSGVVLAGLGGVGRPGMYRSSDGGITWAPVSTFPNREVYAIEFAPNGTAYAGASNGIYRGTQDGTAWQLIGPFFGDITVAAAYTVAIHPTDPNEIWAGIQSASQPTVTLIRSRNGGGSWQNVTPSDASVLTATGITFNRSNPSKVYACFGGPTGGGGVWFSGNGGTTWTYRSAGLPNNPMNDIVNDGTRVLVCGGQEFLNHVVGVFASTNDGVTWTRVHDDSWPSLVVQDLELDPDDPAVILAATARGLFRSTDDGASWTFGIGGTSGYFLNVAKRGHETGAILAGTESYAVIRSADDGAHFAPSSTGFRSLYIVSVAANPNDSRDLAVAFQALNSGGVFSSRDGGASWFLEPVPPTRWIGLAYSRDGTLYALSNGPSTIAREGVYRRNADGSWTGLTPDRGPLYETDLRSIRVSSNDSRLMFAAGQDWVTDRAGIWRSTDGGATWSMPYTGALGAVLDIAIIEDGADSVVMGAFIPPTQQTGAIVRSSDGGSTWATITAGFTPGARVAPRAFGQSSLDPRLFYFASIPTPSLYRSTDGGLHWSAMPSAPRALLDVMCDPLDAGVVYVTGIDSPIVGRSEDGGETFYPFDDGLGVDAAPYAFALSASACPGLLVAAGSGSYQRTIDRTAPELSVGLDQPMLWPPNHEMANVHMQVVVQDACDADPTFALVSITCNETLGAGDIEGADVGTADVDFQLRTERSGGGNGRRYTVTYAATDATAHTRSVSTEIVVPHDQSGARAMPDPDVNAGVAARTALVAIDPNPFRHDADVSFNLSRPQSVNAEVYDARGVLVRRLVSAQLAAGRHHVTWDGRTRMGSLAPSGIYLIRLATPDGQWTRRAALIR